jgi:hypothetical protein
MHKSGEKNIYYYNGVGESGYEKQTFTHCNKPAKPLTSKS